MNNVSFSFFDFCSVATRRTNISVLRTRNFGEGFSEICATHKTLLGIIPFLSEKGGQIFVFFFRFSRYQQVPYFFLDARCFSRHVKTNRHKLKEFQFLFYDLLVYNSSKHDWLLKEEREKEKKRERMWQLRIFHGSLLIPTRLFDLGDQNYLTIRADWWIHSAFGQTHTMLVTYPLWQSINLWPLIREVSHYYSKSFGKKFQAM